MILVTGEELSKELRNELKTEVKGYMIKPCLAIIQVGNDELSSYFIENKAKACSEVGIYLKHINFEEEVKEIEIINKILELNNDDYVNGIILHLPVSSKYNKERLINYIARNKDVDGLTDLNAGKLINNKKTFTPSAAAAMIALCDHYDISLENKNVVIVNNDSLLGKPLSSLLINNNSVVTVCNKETENMKNYTKKADIVVSGVNIPDFVKEDMIKEDAIVFDFGIVKTDGKINGDVDFNGLKEKVSHITPPGEVVSVSVTKLLQNVVESYRKMNTEK